MSLCCVYHIKDGMRVVEDDVATRLVAEGNWFLHPNEAKDALLKKEKHHEEQIRQHAREGSGNRKQPATKVGIRA